ncbi:hypothetical protein FACS1894202_03960 [Clostridia bacterium]|nr:hypothetical protein FACS1894202_03960 [Clostridia bacterium]
MAKKLTSLLLAALMLFGVISSSGVPAFAADGAQNYPLNSIVIKLEDAVTHSMLVGGRFDVYYTNQAVSGGLGTLVATIDTDASGVIIISGIPSGYYTVRQTVPPNNYHLSITNEQHCYIKPDGTSIEELVFSDYRYGGLVVILSDKDTGKPVGGATFSVSDVNNKAVGNAADGVYTTDSKGEFYLENLPAGDYKITQLTTAQGYAMDAVPNSRTVRLQHTNADQSVFRATFENSPLGSLLVRLKDNVSKEPLAGAVFNVKISGGADLGEFTTGANGTFLLPKIARATYIISQVSAPVGYLLATTAKTQYVNYVQTFAVDFENSPKSGLFIVKLDSDTKEALKDAKFHVYKGDTLLGTYTTGVDGVFTVPNLEPGWYTVSEYQAPQGYVLDDTPQSVQVTSEKLHKLTFEDKKLASLQVIKTDEYNGQPLSGAKFRVTTQAGQFVADVTTDATGKATVPNVTPGWYVIAETKAPTGYIISETAKTVEVKATIPTVVTITNRAENNLEIVKLDAYTRTPLSGATFRVEHSNGAKVGTYNTDSTGKILVGSLKEDTYVISEIKAPDGYQLDSEPQIVVIEGGKLQSVEFLDKPLSGIEIIKTDFYSHAPLTGATFVVERDNGERIGSYKTDNAGKIIVADLASGTYIVSETIAPEGYILDAAPQTVVVKNNALTVAEFADKPLSGIQILKTGSDGKTPLAGAVFTIDKPNGERITTGVTNGSGKYTTDVSGKIVVHGLESGVYIVSEVQPPNGYLMDSLPQTVEVKSGKLTLVEFTNNELPNLYIRKIDSATGALIAGAEFLIEKSGVFVAYVVSSATGAVIVPHVQPGIYTITEVKAPAGYELNNPMQNVEVRADGYVYYNSAALSGNTATFSNNPLNSLEIVKLDSVTHNPLSGAMFDVTKANGEKIGSYRTDASGKILIPDISAGTYVISEIAAPQGYILSDAPKSVNVNGGKLVSVEFLNKPLSGIEIVKLDAVSHKPLQGAAFTVTKADGERIGTFRTEADGKVLISDLDEGVYVVGEITAPDGYQLDETPKNVTVASGKLATVEFTNKPLSGIEIVKTDSVTHKPLSGATFEVKRTNGETIGTYKTDVSGKVVVSDLTEGGYIVSELIAPEGYILDNTPQTVTVKTGKLTAVEFTNKPFSGIDIRKVDSISGNALSGAIFEIRKHDGAFVAEVTTDKDGKASVPSVEPGWYTVSETKAPQGYVIDGAAKTVEVKSGAPTVVTISNKPLSGIEILKLDSVSKAPLHGAAFEVTRDNGEKIGTYKTDVSGKIIVSGLADGTYIVSETTAPDGYILDAQPQTVIVKSGKLTQVEFVNKPLSGIIVFKTDAYSHAPLAGATFVIERDNGEKVGTFKTDVAGKIVVSGLTDGTYIISETIAPNGYILDAQPQTVIVKSGKLTEVEFTNKPLTGLKIVKLNSVTRAPIEGVEFTIDRMNGEHIDNNFRQFTFKTDKAGQIYVPSLDDGYYLVTETRASEGYIIDSEPKTVLVQNGKTTLLEVLNTPQSGLLIVKTDEATRKPLAGVKFEVKKPSGEQIGIFTTDISGQIRLTDVPAGKLIVVETQALDGYELDTQAREVTIYEGKQTTLEVTNKAKAGLRLLKIDSVTKKGIYNVEFMVFDANSKQVGTFLTDNNGVIDFAGILTEGRYTIRETRPADGYYRDDMPRTIEFKSGKVTEIVWENTPQMGQIQILKLSGDDNEVNGLPKGTPLAGAVFEIYNYKSGNLVDRFISGTDGRAVSKPLPLGRYTVKEVQAPAWYRLSTETMDIEVEFATQIIKREFLNYSANTGVKIRKTGPYEAMPGDTIRYDIKELANTSTVPLTDFFWRDIIPTDAVRLTKIVTGTYNQSLKYKVLVTTNKGDTRVIADNLSTTVNNVIECRNAALGLANDEYVTSFTLVFGTVKAGFAKVTEPQIYVTVNKGLANGYEFANKCDVGGKYNGEWVIGGSTWLTKVYAQPQKLPRTGY